MTPTKNKRIVSCATAAMVGLLAGCANGGDPDQEFAFDDADIEPAMLADADADDTDDDASYTDCAITDHDEQDPLHVEETGNLRWTVQSAAKHAGADLQVTVLDRASGERTDPVLFEPDGDDAWDVDIEGLVPEAWSGDPLQVWFEVLELAEESRATRAFEFVNLTADSSVALRWRTLDAADAEQEPITVRPSDQVDDPWLVLPDPQAEHSIDELAADDPEDTAYLPGDDLGGITPDQTAVSNAKFCFKVGTSFTDNGKGEDYWTSDSARWARGMRVTIYGGAGVVWSGHLGDGLGSGDPGSGCTPTIGSALPKANDYFVVNLYTNGMWINYNTLDVEVCTSLDSNGNCQSSAPKHASFAIDAPPSNTKTTFTLTPASVGYFSATMAAAYALWRHNGGSSYQSFDVLLNMSSSVYRGGRVEIFSGHHDQKFVIAHEMGHMIGARAMGSRVLTGGSCGVVNITDPARPCRQQGSGNHSILSKEASRCAMAEGFAHFFSADVFNSHNQDDCSFTYYKTTNSTSNPVVNCEGSNPGFPVGPYAQCWYGGWGFGNELSWMRQFWDIHTYGSTNPSLNTMVAWINKVSSLSDKNAYQRFHAAAQASGVSSTIESAWEGLDAYNTVCNSDDPCL